MKASIVRTLTVLRRLGLADWVMIVGALLLVAFCVYAAVTQPPAPPFNR